MPLNVCSDIFHGSQLVINRQSYESFNLSDIKFCKSLIIYLSFMLKEHTNYVVVLSCNNVSYEHEDASKMKECA